MKIIKKTTQLICFDIFFLKVKNNLVFFIEKSS
jgi:hypothetical protein